MFDTHWTIIYEDEKQMIDSILVKIINTGQKIPSLHSAHNFYIIKFSRKMQWLKFYMYVRITFTKMGKEKLFRFWHFKCLLIILNSFKFYWIKDGES